MIFICICTYIRVCVCVTRYIYTHTYICICVYVDAYVYKSIYTNKLSYMHPYIYASRMTCSTDKVNAWRRTRTIRSTRMHKLMCTRTRTLIRNACTPHLHTPTYTVTLHSYKHMQHLANLLEHSSGFDMQFRGMSSAIAIAMFSISTGSELGVVLLREHAVLRHVVVDLVKHRLISMCACRCGLGVSVCADWQVPFSK